MRASQNAANGLFVLAAHGASDARRDEIAGAGGLPLLVALLGHADIGVVEQVSSCI